MINNDLPNKDFGKRFLIISKLLVSPEDIAFISNCL